MTYGEPLVNGSTRPDFNDCRFSEVKQLLEMLLTDEGLKSGLPTINELLETRFIKNTNADMIPTSSISANALSSSNGKLFTSRTKELLVKSREFIEKRMNEEQKAVNLKLLSYYDFLKSFKSCYLI